jgi:outer membrane protein assembly factor BamB
MFYALDKDSGDIVWSYDITQDDDQTSFHGGMLVTHDAVIIGTDTSIGHIYAFDKATGDVRWKYRVSGAGAPTDILRQDSRVFTVVDGDEAICLDLESGKIVWSVKDEFDDETSLLLTPSAAVSDGRMFWGGHAGKIYALDQNSGDIVWTTSIGARVSTSVIAHGDAIFFGAVDGYVYRLSPGTGEILSQFVTELIPTGRPTIDDSGLYLFVNEEPGLGPGRGVELVALDLSLARKLWHHQPDFTWSATKSHIFDQTLVTGTEFGELIAYDLVSGDQEWSFELGGAIRSIGSFGDVLYVGTLEGLVYAVAPR